MSQPPIAALSGVHKSFVEGAGRRVLFDSATLAIERGVVTAVRGRSGTGKTTLLNLLSGIDVADAGEVLFEGAALGALSDRERTWLRRTRIGFVFQFFNLVPTLTVLENVRLPLELGGARPGPAGRRALAWLARVGLADRARSFADRLSGGEQQRVAVVRALVHGPQLVLADEPTGNLDGDSAREVLDILTGLVREEGASLVMATHSAEAAARADRHLEIRGHRVVAIPPPAGPAGR